MKGYMPRLPLTKFEQAIAALRAANPFLRFKVRDDGVVETTQLIGGPPLPILSPTGNELVPDENRPGHLKVKERN